RRGAHAVPELAPPRLLERLLKSLEEGQAALLARDAIGVAPGRRDVEPKADLDAACVERRAAEPGDMELRFPAAAVVKRRDVAGGVRVEAVGVEQLRPALSLSLT